MKNYNHFAKKFQIAVVMTTVYDKMTLSAKHMTVILSKIELVNFFFLHLQKLQV